MSPARPALCGFIVVVLLLPVRFAGAQYVATTEPLTPAEQQKKFHLPAGFKIELVAAEPDIHKPVNLAFDSRGRLFVSDTLEYPFPAMPTGKGRDSVKRLRDTNGDGQFDEITTFVDGLNIPLGVLPVKDGVLVYSIPHVIKCSDDDDDGRADRQKELYGNFGFGDTHGMVNSFTRSLDGWIYACHGFANQSTPAGSDREQIELHSGNTIRMAADGSHIEHFTRGQVNPFGLTLDSFGNLFSADCHTRPIYQLLRGAYYPSFGKAHDGLGFGPEMMTHGHGPSGISGLVYYAAEQFPSEYRDTIFVGNPVTGRINHDRLEMRRATAQAIELPDFLTCDDPWFRPVYLQLGPDGALYVADFYNRIIAHYEVPLDHPGRDRQRGRIWRITYANEKPGGNGAKAAIRVAPDLGRASLAELIAKLDDGNLAVRTLATHELVDRIGVAAAEPLHKLVDAQNASPRSRAHALWASERIAGIDATLLRRLAADREDLVRVHVARVLAERNIWDTATTTLARQMLGDASPMVRRGAAEALGLHPSQENLLPLLKLLADSNPDDAVLIHTARIALRNQLLSPGVYKRASEIARENNSYRASLQSVSLGVPSRESAEFVWAGFAADPEHPARDEYLHHAARYADDSTRDAVTAYVLKMRTSPANEKLNAIRAVRRAFEERGSPVPGTLTAHAIPLVRELVSSDDEAKARGGIEVARELKLAELFDALGPAAGATARFSTLRPAAMDALVACDGRRSVVAISRILQNAAEPLGIRQAAAKSLARANNADARAILAEQLQTAPESLAVELASALAASPEGSELLLRQIALGKASPRLLLNRAVIERMRTHRLKDFDARLGQLTSGLPQVDPRISRQIAAHRANYPRAKKDAGRGAAVFRKACGGCHRIGSEGGKVGPNLDGIGLRGLDRLLEDLLDPNRNVDQAFRSTQIVTEDGKLLAGLVLREEGKTLVMADGQGNEQRIVLDEIEQRTLMQLSPMPANVSEQVPEHEFADLLAFLLAQREAPQPAR